MRGSLAPAGCRHPPATRRSLCCLPSQVDPLTHAQQFVSEAGGFSRPEAVVKAGRHMAATEIAAEPLVRQVVRKQYQVSPRVVKGRVVILGFDYCEDEPSVAVWGAGCAHGAGCRGCAAFPELQRLASCSPT